jgi:hypothetical protein
MKGSPIEGEGASREQTGGVFPRVANRPRAAGVWYYGVDGCKIPGAEP